MLPDILILIFVLLGAGFGYWLGFAKSGIILTGAYLPGLIFIFYFDNISGFVQIVVENSADPSTAILGGLGIFSGLLAMIGVFGGAFAATALLLSMLTFHKPDTPEQVIGALIAGIVQNMLATFAFFLLYTAIPAETSKAMANSYWAKGLYPIHRELYPYYRRNFDERTATLSASIANVGLAQTLIGGVSLTDLIGTDKIAAEGAQLEEVIGEVQELAQSLDIQGLLSVLENDNGSIMNAEDIDRLIASENAKRQSALDLE
ncbi:MAG: hypothetical protein ACON4Q_08615 [Candidatus Puniceispirillaceae bacterium]